MNSIEIDFENKLRATDFKSNLTINSLSLNQLKEVYLKRRVKGQLNFDLIGLHEKRFINISNHLNKIIVGITEDHYENNTPLKQRYKTIGFTRSIEKTNEITFTRTFGFSVGVRAGFKIHIGNISAGFSVDYESSFSENLTVTKRITEKETVTAPPQSVAVSPFSRVNISYYIYRYDNILNNYLDFEVMPHGKELFAFFLKKIGPAIYGQGDLKLEFTNGKIIMRNFLEIEKLPSVGLDVVIHPEEKIPQIFQNSKNVPCKL